MSPRRDRITRMSQLPTNVAQRCHTSKCFFAVYPRGMAAARPLVLRDLAGVVPAFQRLDDEFWAFWVEFARCSGNKEAQEHLVNAWNAKHGQKSFQSACAELERLIQCAVDLLESVQRSAEAKQLLHRS